MRSRVGVAIVAGVLLVIPVSRASGGQQPPAARSGATWLDGFTLRPRDADQRPKPRPFEKLFKSSLRQLSMPVPNGLTGPPAVRCGTTLVPVDPRFDAAIRRQAPTLPRPSARAVPPTTCEETRR